MSKIDKLLGIAILFMFIIIVGCEDRNFVFNAPAGFAEFTKERSSYKAISSDGIRLKVYTIKSDHSGDVKMWKNAVEFYLKGLGYHPILQKDIAAANLNGSYSEYSYRYYGENYIYSLALFVKEKSICIIEAGGKVAYYKKRRDSILKSISEFIVKD